MKPKPNPTFKDIIAYMERMVEDIETDPSGLATTLNNANDGRLLAMVIEAVYGAEFWKWYKEQSEIPVWTVTIVRPLVAHRFFVRCQNPDHLRAKVCVYAPEAAGLVSVINHDTRSIVFHKEQK